MRRIRLSGMARRYSVKISVKFYIPVHTCGLHSRPSVSDKKGSFVFVPIQQPGIVNGIFFHALPHICMMIF